MKKRIWSAASCLFLALALTAGTALGSTPCREGCSLAAGHAGECVLYDAGWQNEAGGAWEYGSLAAALHFVEDGGTVKLMRDFYVSPQTGVPGISKSITLTSADPANPCRLTTAMSPHPTLLGILAEVRLEGIVIDGGSDANDGGLTANGPLVLVQQGDLTLGEGAVIRNNRNLNNSRGNNFLGGGVFLYGTMTMEPGSAIENCFAWAGGGVAVVNGGTMTMEGGVIDGCESYQGGGVCVTNGSFALKDGAVQNCKAVTPEPLTELMDQKLASPGEGGGVFLLWSDSLLEMTGGRIAGNSARFGGGVGCDAGTLQASGGTITGNAAEKYGGGVLASPLLDVRISGDFLVAENASGEPGYEDLYLDGSEGAEGGTATRPFVVTGPVTANIDLGLARWVHPDEEHPYRVVATPGPNHAITAEDLAHFISDAPGLVLQLKDGDIVLTEAKVEFDTQGHGAPVPEQTLASDRKVRAPEPLTETGYDFGGWYTEAECTAKWDFEACLNDYREAPLTLYAQWKPIEYEIVYDLGGGTDAGGNPDHYNVESQEITLHSPKRTGYTFIGWTWAEHETPQQDATIPTGSTEKKSFTARWDPISYPISYELDGGTNAEGNPVSYTVESDAITLEAPTRAGYAFLGWTADGQDAPELAVTIPKGSTGGRAFTAHWQATGSAGSGAYRAITATAGAGGSIDPAGRVRVRRNGDKTFTVAPGEGYAIADVLVDGVSVGAVSEYTFEAVTTAHTIEARFQKADGANGAYRSCPRDATCPIWPYADASTTAWYHDGVHFCIENGLMIGYGDNAFAPDDTLSRGMLAQSLYNKKGRPTPPEAAPFDDVPEAAWYASAVAWAAGNGVVEGYGNGAFGPEDPITREQLAAMLWRYAGRPGSGEALERFPDGAKVSAWATAALRWAVERGIVVGKDDGTLDPTRTATRAEAAAMLQRFCEAVR